MQKQSKLQNKDIFRDKNQSIKTINMYVSKNKVPEHTQKNLIKLK